jgi:hypothetical protein
MIGERIVKIVCIGGSRAVRANAAGFTTQMLDGIVIGGVSSGWAIAVGCYRKCACHRSGRIDGFSDHPGEPLRQRAPLVHDPTLARHRASG